MMAERPFVSWTPSPLILSSYSEEHKAQSCPHSHLAHGLECPESPRWRERPGQQVGSCSLLFALVNSGQRAPQCVHPASPPGRPGAALAAPPRASPVSVAAPWPRLCSPHSPPLTWDGWGPVRPLRRPVPLRGSVSLPGSRMRGFQGPGGPFSMMGSWVWMEVGFWLWPWLPATWLTLLG